MPPHVACHIKKVGIIAKHTIREKAAYVRHLAAELRKHNKDVLPDEYVGPLLGEKTAYDKTQLLTRADLVIVLGGDGTLLKTARQMGTKKPFIAGVNMGHLGFLTAFTPQKLLDSLAAIFAGHFCPDERFLLRVTIYRSGKKKQTTLALNDAVINQGGFARLITLRTEVNRRRLADYRADGLIISTPTGSTGHSLSAGGAIIHPKIAGFVLTPLCPIKLGMRPIIIPNDRQITIKLETEWRAEKKPIVLTLDGQVTINLKKDDIIRIRRSSRTFNLIRMSGHNYYQMLRKKLSWG
ncbi:NAD(+)/NADH kinase [Candidatus Peregrinibacteria bacterium]|nr:NAD(+)/NADH kinase [Candidatus Peregrinibacteria bacterium]